MSDGRCIVEVSLLRLFPFRIMTIQHDPFQYRMDLYIGSAGDGAADYWPSSVSQTVSESMFNTVSTVKTQVANSISSTLNGASTLLDQSVDQVGGMGQSLVDQIVEAIARQLQSWLDMHPVIGWMAYHPLLAAFGVLVIIFLLWSLLQTLLQLTQDLWAKILQLPLIFGMFVIRKIVSIIKPSSAVLFRRHSPETHIQPITPEHDSAAPQEAEVIAMFVRLEELSREQNLILRELTSRLQHQMTEERSPQA